MVAELHYVFARLDRDDGWQTLQTRLALFHRLAREAAMRWGLDYPAALEAQIIACIEGLRQEEAAF